MLIRRLKYFTFCMITCVSAAFLILTHLQREITRLDEARVKMEKALETAQTQNLLIKTPAGYVQQPSFSLNTEEFILIYNRVPKTASTTFAGIAYDLYLRNKFHVLRINIAKNNHALSVADQMRFINNITHWKSKMPAFYHGHLAYLEFSRFPRSMKPIYINLIRDPVDRLISHYYFVRHGDDLTPHVKRKRSGNRETFDECVAKDGTDCRAENLWMQIPFFCGHASECWIPGSRWALERAKYNLVNSYLLVGLTEELGDFVAVLEATLPGFFAGATELYNSGGKSHLRKTSNKLPPSRETIEQIQGWNVCKLESEFYEFAKDHFRSIKRRTFDLENGYMLERKQQFSFEKIRP